MQCSNFANCYKDLYTCKCKHWVFLIVCSFKYGAQRCTAGGSCNRSTVWDAVLDKNTQHWQAVAGKSVQEVATSVCVEKVLWKNTTKRIRVCNYSLLVECVLSLCGNDLSFYLISVCTDRMVLGHRCSFWGFRKEGPAFLFCTIGCALCVNALCSRGRTSAVIKEVPGWKGQTDPEHHVSRNSEVVSKEDIAMAAEQQKVISSVFALTLCWILQRLCCQGRKYVIAIEC